MTNPWQQPLSILMDEGLKRKFAMLLAQQPDKAFTCACEIFPENVGLALQASHLWPRDPIVTEILAIVAIKKPPVPSREEAALKALSIAEATVNGSDKYMYDGKDRIAAIKLFAEIMGYIDKGAINTAVNVDARVLVVPQFRSEADFEAAAVKQQTNLILAARKPNAPKT